MNRYKKAEKSQEVKVYVYVPDKIEVKVYDPGTGKFKEKTIDCEKFKSLYKDLLSKPIKVEKCEDL